MDRTFAPTDDDTQSMMNLIDSLERLAGEIAIEAHVTTDPQRGHGMDGLGRKLQAMGAAMVHLEAASRDVRRFSYGYPKRMR